MLVHCYGQSWYKYQISIVSRELICRDLRDQVMDVGMVRLTYEID